MADLDGFVDAYDAANHGKKVRVPEHFLGDDSPFPNLRATPLSRGKKSPDAGATTDSEEKK
ncbi:MULTISPECIES: hypothetical protein [Dermacoccus]|jgi:hypothetical protein|uniref:hypothetical protein n=1 Tax=Dermacoccus TaxID=57495 RepID=UPI00093E6683|nr:MULTISPECIES: hypothetical protein [Dermacoccus]